MSGERTMRVSARDRIKGRTDYARLEALSEEAIAEAAADDPDAAPLDIDWSRAEIVMPSRKVPVSIRLDEDVISYFRTGGAGYQGRINAVLRSYVDAKRRGNSK